LKANAEVFASVTKDNKAFLVKFVNGSDEILKYSKLSVIYYL